MAPVIAVDLGGTSLRAACFPTPDPGPTAQVKTPTLASEGPHAVVSRMIDAIQQVMSPDRAGLRISVAAPGPLDPFRGVILDMPNLPGWQDFPLAERLKEHFHCPVLVGNDANLAAVGEWRHGAARGTNNMIYLTISTGIGGGAIVHGKMLIGARGLATELGHMMVEPGGPLCGCGQRGHLESVASGLAIARQAQERVEAGEPSALQAVLTQQGSLNAQDVAAAALQGDSLAHQVYTQAGEAIGTHLASLAHAFDPEVIVIGGGVARCGQLLLGPMERSLHAHLMHPAFSIGLRLLPAALGDDSGLIGAMVVGYEQ